MSSAGRRKPPAKTKGGHVGSTHLLRDTQPLPERDALEREQARALAKAVGEADRPLARRRGGRATAAGDARRLRGVPCVAPGVEGATPDSKPGAGLDNVEAKPRGLAGIRPELRRLMERVLTAKQRYALEQWLLGLSPEQIAASLGVSRQLIAARIRTAVAKLRAELAGGVVQA